MEYLLPSDIARLVYGYLKDDNCDKAATLFLETSTFLRECRLMFKKGCYFHTKVMGKSLVEMLDIFSEMVYAVDNYVHQNEEKLTATEVLSRLSHIFNKGVPSNFSATKNKKNHYLKGNVVKRNEVEESGGDVDMFSNQFDQVDCKVEHSLTDDEKIDTGINLSEPQISSEKGPLTSSCSTKSHDLFKNQSTSLCSDFGPMAVTSSAAALPPLIYTNTFFTLPVMGNFKSISLMPHSNVATSSINYNITKTLPQSSQGGLYRPILPKPSAGPEVIVPELLPPPVNDVSPVSVIPVKIEKKAVGRPQKVKGGVFELKNLFVPSNSVTYENIIRPMEESNKTDSNVGSFFTSTDPLKTQPTVPIDSDQTEDDKRPQMLNSENLIDILNKTSLPPSETTVRSDTSIKKKGCSKKSWDSDLRSYIEIPPSPKKKDIPLKKKKSVLKKRKKSKKKKTKCPVKNVYRKTKVSSVKPLDSLLSLNFDAILDFDDSVRRSIDLYNAIVDNNEFIPNSNGLLQGESSSAVSDKKSHKTENLSLPVLCENTNQHLEYDPIEDSSEINLNEERRGINASFNNLQVSKIFSPERETFGVINNCTKSSPYKSKNSNSEIINNDLLLNDEKICYENDISKEVISDELDNITVLSQFKTNFDSNLGENVVQVTRTIPKSVGETVLSDTNQIYFETEEANHMKGIKNSSNFSICENTLLPVLKCQDRVDDLLIKQCLTAVSSSLFTKGRFRRSYPMESYKNRIKLNKTIVKGKKSSSDLKCSMIQDEYSKHRNVCLSSNVAEEKGDGQASFKDSVLLLNCLEESNKNIACNLENYEKVTCCEKSSSLYDFPVDHNVNIKGCDGSLKEEEDEKQNTKSKIDKRVKRLIERESIRIKAFKSSSRHRKRTPIYNLRKHSKKSFPVSSDQENIYCLKVNPNKLQSEPLSQFNSQNDNQDKLYFLKKASDRLTSLCDCSQLDFGSDNSFDDSSPLKNNSSFHYSLPNIDSVNGVPHEADNINRSNQEHFLDDDAYSSYLPFKSKRKHQDSCNFSSEKVKKIR